MQCDCEEMNPASCQQIATVEKTEETYSSEMGQSTKTIIVVLFVLMILVMVASVALSVIIIRMARERLRRTATVWNDDGWMERIAAFFLATDSVLSVRTEPRGWPWKKSGEHAFASGTVSSFVRATDAMPSTSQTSGLAHCECPATCGMAFHAISEMSYKRSAKLSSGYIAVGDGQSTARSTMYGEPSTVCGAPSAVGKASSGWQKGDAVERQGTKRPQPPECPAPVCNTDLCLPSSVCPPLPPPREDVCGMSTCSGSPLRSCTDDGKTGCVLNEAKGDAKQQAPTSTKVEGTGEQGGEGKGRDIGTVGDGKGGDVTDAQEKELECGKGGCNLGDPMNCDCEEETSRTGSRQ